MPDEMWVEFESDKARRLLDALSAQTDYSSHLLTEYEALLHMVRRVDQVHGPFAEFKQWRDGPAPTPEGES